MAPEAPGTDMELPLLTGIPTGIFMEPPAGIATDMEPPEAATGFLVMATEPATLLVPVGPRMLPFVRSPLGFEPVARDSETEGLDGAPARFSGPIEYGRGTSLLANRRTWLRGEWRAPGFGLAYPSVALSGARNDCSGERCDNNGVRCSLTNAPMSTAD